MVASSPTNTSSSSSSSSRSVSSNPSMQRRLQWFDIGRRWLAGLSCLVETQLSTVAELVNGRRSSCTKHCLLADRHSMHQSLYTHTLVHIMICLLTSNQYVWQPVRCGAMRLTLSRLVLVIAPTNAVSILVPARNALITSSRSQHIRASFLSNQRRRNICDRLAFFRHR